MTREDREMAQRIVRVSRPWMRQTPKVAFPVTITKPNGESFTVAPTRKRVAKRKPAAKRQAKRVAKLPAPQVVPAPQDTRAIALEERRQAFAESQRALELAARGSYN